MKSRPNSSAIDGAFATTFRYWFLAFFLVPCFVECQISVPTATPRLTPTRPLTTLGATPIWTTTRISTRTTPPPNVSASSSASNMTSPAENALSTDVLKIAIPAGVGGGLLVLVIIVVIVVVASKRRKRQGRERKPPQRPLPRIPSRKPPAPPPRPSTNDPIYNNTIEEENKGDIVVEYEILDLEREMAGWSSHLQNVKRENGLADLGVYTIAGDYYAQTPGFTLSHNEVTAVSELMSRRLSYIRRNTDLGVGNNIYTVNPSTTTATTLKGMTGDKTKCLRVVARDEYMVIAISRPEESRNCERTIRDILNIVTRNDQLP